MITKITPLAVGLLIAARSNVVGQEITTNGVTTLPTIVVVGEAAHEELVKGQLLPDVAGTKIYSGKKATVVDFDAMPQIQSDNYRQAFSQTPGLLVSELSNPSLLSLGSRGIGDPHETQNLLVLKDGCEGRSNSAAGGVRIVRRLERVKGRS